MEYSPPAVENVRQIEAVLFLNKDHPDDSNNGFS